MARVENRIIQAGITGMRLNLPRPPTSPLPHQDDPPPLLRSPTSMLGLTASEKRRRKRLVRATSSEPTVAGGLANWRRQPKKQSSAAASTNTGSAGTSETKKARRGAGMGMQGTPAKKGKRSSSKGMGVHSTPIAKIHSRTQSLSQGMNQATAAIPAASSGSSANSSLPSSADFDTPSEQSQIPNLSSPSIRTIAALNRRLDVFDGAYMASSNEATSEEEVDFNRLIEEAQENEIGEQPPEDFETEEEGDVDGLFGWKEDVLWSLRGSTNTSPTPQDGESNESGKQPEGDDLTIRNVTVYHDILMSMNDDSDEPRSISSRTKRRSSTIQNRQPTPHKRSAGSSGKNSTVRKAAPARVGPHTLNFSPSLQEETFYTARTGRDFTTAPGEGSSASARILPEHVSLSAESPSNRPSTSNLSNRLGSLESSDKAERKPREFNSPVSHALPAETVTQSTLSQLLAHTDPIPPGVTLSQLLNSTQSMNGTERVDPDVSDGSIEIGRGGKATALPDHDYEYQQPESHNSSTHLPSPAQSGYDVNDIPHHLDTPSSDGPEPLFPPPMTPIAFNNSSYNYRHGSYIPVPYTSSSHISPRLLQAPLSPISFATTRSPSVDPRITPPPSTRNPAKKKRKPKLKRKGAWKGAEVLARMDEANRGTARYHMAFDQASPPVSGGGDVREGSGLMTRRARAAVEVFEESDDVLEARRKRIEHYKELELDYRLHVELVY